MSSIETLEIGHFRNIAQSKFKPSRHINIITGLNGSGKSSLIEAIVLLATGKSFRATTPQHYINHESDETTLFCEVMHDEVRHRIGVSKRRDLNNRIRLDGANHPNHTQVTKLLPIVLIDPITTGQFLQQTEARRNYLDWTLFHVEHSYQDIWRRFRHTLQQRNAVLRQQDRSQIRVWDDLFSQVSAELHAYRIDVVSRLQSVINRYISVLTDQRTEVTLEYRQGWNRERELSEILSDSTGKEFERGYSLYGPHRADLRFRMSGIDSLEQSSRGEQKLLVLAARLTQADVIDESLDARSILLCDDIASELDSSRRAVFFNALLQRGRQLFYTTTDIGLVPPSPEGAEMKVFHVEHGDLREVLY